jgi:hypothetical protein
MPYVFLSMGRASGPGIWMGAAALMASLVLAILVGGCGSDTSSTAASGAGSTPAGSQTAEAVLEPTESSDLSAKATFVLTNGTLHFAVKGKNLPRTEKNLYTAWLTGSSGDMFPLGTYQVGRDQVLDSEIEVSAVDAVPFLADGAHDEVALATTNVTKLEAETAELSEFGHTPSYTGKTLMRGRLSGSLTEADSGG